MDIGQHAMRIYTAYYFSLDDEGKINATIGTIKKDIQGILNDQDVQLNPFQKEFFDSVIEILAGDNYKADQYKELMELINKVKDYKSKADLDQGVKTLKDVGFHIKN